MSSSIMRRGAALVAAGVASVAASILLPGGVISLYALAVRDADAITTFAVSVAEPLALLGAAGVAFAFSRWGPPHAADRRRWSLQVGGVAAACVAGAALWVGDVDGWTAAAALALPAAALLGGRRAREATPSRRAAPGAGADVDAAQALPGPGVAADPLDAALHRAPRAPRGR